MSFLAIKKDDRRQICSEKLQKQLRKAGITHCHESAMESVLKEWNWLLPGHTQIDDELYYGFMIDGRQELYLNYADACAAKILFIIKNKLSQNGEQGDKD